MSEPLQLHGLQHMRPPCPLRTPRVYSNSCPLSWWYHPTISSSVTLFPPAFSLSHQGIFKWVSSSHQVAKVLSFSFNISPSNDYSGLISFRMDWLYLLAVQGTLKAPLALGDLPLQGDSGPVESRAVGVALLGVGNGHGWDGNLSVGQGESCPLPPHCCQL